MTPLIHWDFSGKSNADAGTIVEDLTGNGYDLELKNFAFDNESGYNGYPTDFRKWTINSQTNYDPDFPISLYENKIVFDGTIGDNYISCGISNSGIIQYLGDQVVVKVSGLKEGSTISFFNYSKESSKEQTVTNGIHIIDTKDYGINPYNLYISYLSVYSQNQDKTLNNVTVEIFPLYPDQLVFNGINNFCQCTKDFVLPNSRGYTWIVKYKILKNTEYLVGKGVDSTHNILTIVRDSAARFAVYSYSALTYVTAGSFDKNIIYGTSEFTGDFNIVKGAQEDTVNNKLVLGTLRPTEPSRYFNGTISEFYLFDRDLTQSQIEKFISDNMIPLPEVYYDVEKQGTLNEHTTKDKLIDFSGNENHGTLHNFTFDESNGWGYYNDSVEALKKNTGLSSIISCTYDNHKLKVTSNNSASGNPPLVMINTINGVEGENLSYTRKDIKFRITGLTNSGEQSFYINKYINDGEKGSWINLVTNITTDGIYTVPGEEIVIEAADTGIPNLIPFRFGIFSGVPSDNLDITVEFLPDYGDCLRFNADAKTYVSLDTLTKGFKTVFMVTELQDNTSILYDQRANPNNPSIPFAILSTGIAYNDRNNGGVTYINGELNTTISSTSLLNVKHCLTIVNDTVTDDSTTPVIGDRTDLINDGQYATTMKLYKFLGFKEALSEKQIKMVIEKYGLQID